MKITVSDIRDQGYCVIGIRDWFSANGFSRAEFREFLRHGIDSDEIVSRGDEIAKKVVEAKRGR